MSKISDEAKGYSNQNPNTMDEEDAAATVSSKKKKKRNVVAVPSKLNSISVIF